MYLLLVYKCGLNFSCCRSGPGSLLDTLSEYQQFTTENVNNENELYSADCIHENLYSIIYSENDTLKNKTMEILDEMKNRSTKFLMSLPPHVRTNIYSYIL